MKINENKSLSLCGLFSSHTIFNKLPIQPLGLSRTVKKNISAFAELEHTGEENLLFYYYFLFPQRSKYCLFTVCTGLVSPSQFLRKYLEKVYFYENQAVSCIGRQESFVGVAAVAPMTADSASLTTLVIQPLMARSLETGTCTWVPELAKQSAPGTIPTAFHCFLCNI